ncbi:isochorismatase family protein [Croceibacterium mercuriale]|uniref:isochorismatase family protein n=1 Tax=Croceibacterium mercuriale TaxID=1572751 RepID=UPI0006894523|nr:isochorismatase family protein [Croceibacterium mercuriale]
MSDTPRRLPGIAPYALPLPAEWPASRADWVLERDRAALLVHDMQHYFVDAFQAAPVPDLVQHIGTLLAAARGAGVPVFYTAQQGDQLPADRGRQADLWGPGMRQVAEHQPIVPALAPATDDIVLVKHRYSAFQRSNLEVLLRARGRDQLIVCGIYAHIGCLFTAAEAFQLDLQPFMVGDALGDFSREWHDAALAQAADCCARVVATTDVLEALQ